MNFPSVDSWTSAMVSLKGSMGALPDDADMERSEMLLDYACTRRAAPVQQIWHAAKSGELDSAIGACELLSEPQRWSMLTAMAAHFAETKNATAFDRIWPLVMKRVNDAKPAGDLPNAALARCAAFRPASLVEIARLSSRRAESVFAILARRAPVDEVAAVFAAIENACIGLKLDDELIHPLARGGRSELAAACLPLIRSTVTLPRENSEPLIIEPKCRRDEIRSRTVQGLSHLRRYAEALAVLATYEDAEKKVAVAISLYVEMGNPLKALEAFRECKEPVQMLTVFEELCEALGSTGEMEAVLEVASVAQRDCDRTFATELVHGAFQCAIKAGHVAGVSAVLDRLRPPSLRKKIEEQIARVSNKAEPKSLRGRVAVWLNGHVSQMPDVIARIEESLKGARPAECVFLLCALLRAQAKAGRSVDVGQTIVRLEEELRTTKSRALRIEGTQEAAAATVAVGRQREALRMLDAVCEALDDWDKDGVREFVRGFVEACAALNVKEHLVNLPKDERDESGCGLFIEDEITWQGARSDETDKLVARASKSGDFSTVIDMLRAQRNFAQAADVLRHAPVPRNVDWSSLAEEAADFRQDAIVLDILATIGSPVPGEHPPGTRAMDLVQSYIFRSAHGLPGSTLDHLIHALAEPLDLADDEFRQAAIHFAATGRMHDEEYGEPHVGEQLVAEHGSWEAAMAHVRSLPRESQSAWPSKLLLSLAVIGIRDGLSAGVVEDALGECCDRLDVLGPSAYEAREILSALAHIQMEGMRVPDFEAKAGAVLDAFPAQFVWDEHRIHLFAALGHWEEALGLLPTTCGLDPSHLAGPYNPACPWRILRVVPLPALRKNAAATAVDLPAAWMIAAAFAARQPVRGGLLARLSGSAERKAGAIVNRIKRSIKETPAAFL